MRGTANTLLAGLDHCSHHCGTPVCLWPGNVQRPRARNTVSRSPSRLYTPLGRFCNFWSIVLRRNRYVYVDAVQLPLVRAGARRRFRTLPEAPEQEGNGDWNARTGGTGGRAVPGKWTT
jgi:hypothetical protein